MAHSRFRIFGSIAIAALISAAAMSPTSAAAEFRSEAETTTLTSSATSRQVVDWGFSEFSWSEFDCEEVKFESSQMEGSEATEVRVSPSYEGCKSSLNGQPVNLKIEFTGCSYLLTAGEADEVGHYPLHIECPEGQAVHVKIFLLGFWRSCLEIQPQTPENGIVYSNAGSKSSRDLQLKWTLTGVEYSSGVAVCGSGGSDLALTGETTLTGETEAEEPVGIWFE